MWAQVPSPFPPAVAFVACRSDRELIVRLTPEEEAFIAGAGERRRRDFAAGRHAAREALIRLGIDGGSLLRGAGGEPLWPPGIAGSISHSADYAVAAAARKSDFDYVGVDIEDLMRPLRRDITTAIAAEP